MLSHTPVLLQEVLVALDIREGGRYLDATFGRGGHSAAILERVGPQGAVIAFDRDPAAIAAGRERFANDGRMTLVSSAFSRLGSVVAQMGLEGAIDGVLLDLGVSSMQLDEAERGFSFRQHGPLDMRMGQSGLSAADLVNHAPPEELASLIFRYGEDRHSRRIARRIAEAREQAPIETTEALAEVVARAYPPGGRRDHPARRTFQALRIAVNDELGALQGALAALERVLAPGGRAVVLTYHSLEDRIVKHFFKGHAAFTPLSKKPLGATPDEVARNPRARSAKLRAAALTSPIPSRETL